MPPRNVERYFEPRENLRHIVIRQPAPVTDAGGKEQIQRLKGTLREWLRDLVAGPYDSAYVAKRWRVGWRHVEIGLDQVIAEGAKILAGQVRGRIVVKIP